MNLLILANELRYTCGVTNHLLHLTDRLSRNKNNNIFIITGGGNGIDRFDNLNVKVLEDKNFLHESRSPLNYLSAVNVLAKFIKQNSIDIAHSHSHYAANIATLSSKLKQIPRIQTNHGLLEDTGKLKHFTADKYVTINQHIYDYIIKSKIAKPADVMFIRCGIPVPAEPAAKKDKPISVLAASRFIPEKGLDNFIRAVSKIPKDVKEKAVFCIAGEGKEEDNLKKLNKDLKSRIKFLGRVNNLPELLNDNHIFVYPSRSNNEGFPAVITEAGANNNLLISSDFRGAQDTLKHGINCLVYPADDVESLATRITHAITEYHKLTHIAVNLYNRVKDLYNLNNMIAKHEELYEKCLIT
jgi:glycosyltransferase involved in cell wall biosynthesis